MSVLYFFLAIDKTEQRKLMLIPILYLSLNIRRPNLTELRHPFGINSNNF